ncbi:NADH-quinone oxidoreductase subunit C [Halorhodospira neutriphila]|uniref:NADH-quinone oxidoreductase subunit C n=1 Tax=Halorhodospira neutriphila TaxID=168379 RepID=A0ABS1E5M3_9GAMM|nr:NADH-quinone oxidoreductase subunit C [Halorhodospira neutriphila]MBK1726119.1 NADH-quinone oxidoreductase subunit C [Halorhodospira neutriphila]
MAEPESLYEQLRGRFGERLAEVRLERGEVTAEVRPAELTAVMAQLRDEQPWRFEQLVDIAGVDYAAYGGDEWITERATSSGFSRGVTEPGFGRLGLTGIYGVQPVSESTGRRFAAVYHLLSLSHNHRLRVRCFAEDDDMPVLPSVTGIWPAADWAEREAFDLYGIVFEGHPDLRRLLTDYGFVGHPFRKDFPLIGNVEPRYDPEKGRVVYGPVEIEPRVLVPRVIRDDNRYRAPGTPEEDQADG